MTTTAFTTVQAAMLAALQAAPALADGRISTNRLRAIPVNQATAIVLRLDQTAGAEVVLGHIDWQTTYVVECYARAATGSDPALAVDALLTDAWARLAGMDGGAIGADISLQPQIDWQYDDADTPVVCAVIRINAQHRTAANSITQP